MNETPLAIAKTFLLRLAALSPADAALVKNELHELLTQRNAPIAVDDTEWSVVLTPNYGLICADQSPNMIAVVELLPLDELSTWVDEYTYTVNPATAAFEIIPAS